VPYYHVVFTLPHALHPLLLHNQKELYRVLFDSAAGTLLEFAKTRLHGTPGITAILHTWGQQLGYHPHLHCIVTGGALSDDQQTWTAPKQARYLFPEAAVAALFRGKFMADLRSLASCLKWPKSLRLASFEHLYKQHWHVFLKRPFGGPQQALAYLANYTHRVAIANSRIQAIDPVRGTVRFSYRDYADANRVKATEIPGADFIARFCLHILPRGFTKIRHYGILANNRKQVAIPQARLLLHSRRSLQLFLELLEKAKLANKAPEPITCPACNHGVLLPVVIAAPRGARLCKLRPFSDTS
jgi:hypothetical protein